MTEIDKRILELAEGIKNVDLSEYKYEELVFIEDHLEIAILLLKWFKSERKLKS